MEKSWEWHCLGIEDGTILGENMRFKNQYLQSHIDRIFVIEIRCAQTFNTFNNNQHLLRAVHGAKGNVVHKKKKWL